MTSGPGDGATIERSFRLLRDGARSEIAVPAAVRKDRLRRLLALLEENAGAFEAAISADFGHRSVHETRLAEALIVEAGIKLALRRLGSWMRSRRVPTRLPFWPGSNRLMVQPLGVVGIIAPWNYPLQLTLAPLVGALAAGNRVMIKPSELVPRFSALLGAAVGKRFDASDVAVVEGGPAVAQAFAALPFDHLLFTGSTRVGRLVAEAAARNLTPVTLELGGKSPVIIDRSADLAAAARRVAVGKLLNAGQTCIAPDYVLCPRGTEEQFAERYLASVTALYGSDPRNRDYTSIVTETHYERLEHLLADAVAKGARVVRRAEGLSDWKGSRKFPPCLVLATTDAMLVRQEEIFGPILPIIPYDGTDDAIAFVNERDRPLALYWFGRNAEARDRILRETVSGGVTVNDCLLHIAQENQPFGGVGASGMGAYHGEWGFRAFSKAKPVFYRPRVSGTALLQPPYGKKFAPIFAVVRRLI
jgi:coniferyl-aldehyde dehydrogenase